MMKNKIILDIAAVLNVDKDSIKIEYPKERTFGDYAIPCFQFSKELHKSPMDIANYLKDNLSYECNVVNGYLNIFMDKKETTQSVISTILNEKDSYGNNSYGKGKNLVIEYSSPNVAKPFASNLSSI